MTQLARGTEEYLSSLAVERGLAQNTLAAYRRDLTDYLEFLDGSTPDPALLDRYLSSLERRGLAASTVARRIAAIRGLHRFLVAEGFADADPTLLVDAPRRTEPLPKALTIDEVIAILEAPDRSKVRGRRDAAVLEFLYATGARVSEAVGVDLALLDLDEKIVRLRGKGDKERVVPVGGAAVAAVVGWLPDRLRLRRGSTDAVFLSLRGNRLSRQAVFEMVREHAGRAGVRDGDVSPHVLRHSTATHLLEGGADLRIVQEILGHASVSTTQVYTRVSPRHLLEVYLGSHPRSS